MRKFIFLSLASLLLVVGFIGIIIPGLPTTPFLILSSYFAARSSPRFQAFLLSSRLFGPVLRDWQQYRGIRFRVKWQAMSLVVIALGIFAITAPHSPVGLTLVILLGVVGLCVIWHLPTIPQSRGNGPVPPLTMSCRPH